ncbi:Transcriptional regulator, contains XRE-family HTH domain [Sinosporangium album]|uniref:Transcriptional regulator, contains XRE-family HTH domain n=1 Tax=Sinosporangium album TaxID=504805 RepID=A0A1G8HYI9_9ACTN|nr:helix-turn-helix transcriptional regulator [Sinosporangium album]SDI11708.1 Transcriptional regulator, contains XRE-family HTH domain [Sinosporangium album]
MRPGEIVRLARQAKHWRLKDLGDRCGYSAAQISRLERGLAPLTDITLLHALADILDIPPARLGIAPAPILAERPLPGDVLRSVEAETDGEDDDVRRRELLQSAGISVPLAVLARVDDALAVMKTTAGTADLTHVRRSLDLARAQFAAGRLAPMIDAIPDLLANAHTAAGISLRPVTRQATVSGKDPVAISILAGCYDLASEALHKTGRTQAARLTADRATTYAALSEDPVAVAMAARSLAVVLRHEGRETFAEQVSLDAATALEHSSVRTPDALNTLAQIYCTSAYSAASAGDRTQAMTLIGEARAAARAVPTEFSTPSRFVVTPAQVDLYLLGIHWALGETGAALQTGRNLKAVQFATVERRARLFTDFARVLWQAKRPEPTARALLTAHQYAPPEVNRTSITALAWQLVRHHPRVRGVDRLSLILRRP